MISLDVVFLFTNVPLSDTIDFMYQQLLKKHISIRISEFGLEKLILYCTINVYFVFNNAYYRQIDGIAMDSPLGFILADFSLAKLQNGPLKEVIAKLDFYRRYTYGAFIIVDQNIGKEELLELFDNKHSAIRFMCEEEFDKKTTFPRRFAKQKRK